MQIRLVALLLGISFAAGCATQSPVDPIPAPQVEQSPQPLTLAPLDAEICRLLSAPSVRLRESATQEILTLEALYAARRCDPLWSDGNGWTQSGIELLDRIRRIGVTDPMERPASPAEREILLSAAFAALAVDPAEPALRPSASRLTLLAADAARDPRSLRLALPVDPQIHRLRDAIAFYRNIERSGGWPEVPDGPKLTLGSKSTRVAALRERLRTSGDIEATASDPTVFDAMLNAGLRRFQARHGLQVDGVAAKETLAALNVPVTARIALLTANLRRKYSQQRDWGLRYVAVNIAAATMTLLEDGHPVVQRRAIVGRPAWPTPQLDSVIDRLEFHPSWTVPTRIAQLELMPKIRKDKTYLKRNHMRIVDGQIRQAPGPDNPLGQIKFVFANPFSVYLHDTNAPGLFDRPQRFLSHGCVRVEQAVDLARRLLQDDPAWPPARIDATLANAATQRVDLSRPIPVHLAYDTAWVDERGVVNFRRDAYELDPAISALRTAAGGVVEGNCGS